MKYLRWMSAAAVVQKCEGTRWSRAQVEYQRGGALVAQYLAYIMLIQALRQHLAEGLRGGVGRLFALADKQMSAATTAMHESPGHRWTLQELGSRAGMSRSMFALKFKQTMGTSPMEYLTRWRMLVAGDRPTHSGGSPPPILRPQ